MSAAVCVCSIFNGTSAKCIQQLTQVADLTLISQMGLSSQLHVIMFDKWEVFFSRYDDVFFPLIVISFVLKETFSQNLISLDSFSAVKYLLIFGFTRRSQGFLFFFSAPSSSSSDSSGPGHCLCGPRASDCGFWCLFPGQSTSGSHGKGDFTAWPPGPLAKQQQRFPVKRAWEPVERWTPLPCPPGCWPEQLTTLSFNYIRPTQNPHLWSTVRLCFKPLVPDQLMAFIDTIFLSILKEYQEGLCPVTVDVSDLIHKGVEPWTLNPEPWTLVCLWLLTTGVNKTKWSKIFNYRFMLLLYL